MTSMRRFAAAVAVVGLGCAVGCGTGERVRGAYDERRAERQVQGGELEAGEVYTAARALNQGELDAIAAAQGRIDDPQLQAFAEKVDAHHRQSLQRLEAAAARLEGLTVVERDLTAEIEEDARADAAALADVRGDGLDEQLIDTMVDSHQRALNVIDSRLLPAATGDFLQVISEMRSDVTAHLEEARRLQEALAK